MTKRGHRDDRRSSMRTLFELRASRWFVRALIGAVLAGAGYAAAHHFIP